jgi:hypothetical protein
MQIKDLSIDHVLESLESAIEQKKSQLGQNIAKTDHSPLVNIMAIQTLFGLNSLKEIIHKAQEATDTAMDTFQEEISESPWRFLGKVGLISLGVGLMLGGRIQGRKRQ